MHACKHACAERIEGFVCIGGGIGFFFFGGVRGRRRGEMAMVV